MAGSIINYVENRGDFARNWVRPQGEWGILNVEPNIDRPQWYLHDEAVEGSKVPEAVMEFQEGSGMQCPIFNAWYVPVGTEAEARDEALDRFTRRVWGDHEDDLRDREFDRVLGFGEED